MTRIGCGVTRIGCDVTGVCDVTSNMHGIIPITSKPHEYLGTYVGQGMLYLPQGSGICVCCAETGVIHSVFDEFRAILVETLLPINLKLTSLCTASDGAVRCANACWDMTVRAVQECTGFRSGCYHLRVSA